MSYSHLNDETRKLMELDLPPENKRKVLLDWILLKHFVYHERAKKCLDEIIWIINRASRNQGDFPSDLPGMALIGDTGTGKSSIIEECIRIYASEHHLTKESIVIAYIIMKDSATGLKGLYSAMYYPFGHPYSNVDLLKYKKITVDQLEETLLLTLKNVDTKLLFVDEFQHVKGRNKQAIVNQFKRTILLARIPIVISGTPDVRDILDFDPQLADRCPIKPYSQLPFLSNNKEYRQFLDGYQKFLPFAEKSDLASEDLATMIFKKVQFQNQEMLRKRPELKNHSNYRNLAEYLKKVSVTAFGNNHTSITEEDIRETDL